MQPLSEGKWWAYAALCEIIGDFERASKRESSELECMDDERRQVLEEAAELDHIWGEWEAEAEPTNDPNERFKQPSLSRGDVRYHVEVYASHRGPRWELPSASLIERDPEVIPDVGSETLVVIYRAFFFFR
jgi:hypothetical protein